MNLDPDSHDWLYWTALSFLGALIIVSSLFFLSQAGWLAQS